MASKPYDVPLQSSNLGQKAVTMHRMSCDVGEAVIRAGVVCEWHCVHFVETVRPNRS